jgi:hypothetical protein
MSQFTHTRTPLGAVIRSHSTAVIAALIALVATTAVVLVLAVGDDSSTSPAPASVVPAAESVRPDGGPEESNIASAVGGSSSSYSHPDEAAVADAISGR